MFHLNALEGLDRYTPALCDIAGLEPNYVATFNATNPDGSTMNSWQQLNHLFDTHDSVRGHLIEEGFGEEVFRPAMELSLGALVRIARYPEWLGRGKIRAGYEIKRMARLAVEDATNYGMGSERPYARIYASQINSHVASHAKSYATLLPLMGIKQRMEYRSKIRVASPDLLTQAA